MNRYLQFKHRVRVAHPEAVQHTRLVLGYFESVSSHANRNWSDAKSESREEEAANEVCTEVTYMVSEWVKSSPLASAMVGLHAIRQGMRHADLDPLQVRQQTRRKFPNSPLKDIIRTTPCTKAVGPLDRGRRQLWFGRDPDSKEYQVYDQDQYLNYPAYVGPDKARAQQVADSLVTGSVHEVLL